MGYFQSAYPTNNGLGPSPANPERMLLVQFLPLALSKHQLQIFVSVDHRHSFAIALTSHLVAYLCMLRNLSGLEFFGGVINQNSI